MVYHINKLKIMPPDCSPKMPYVEEEDYTFIQQNMLEFGLVYDGIVQSKRLLGKLKLGTSDYCKNNNSKSSEDKWKVRQR